MIFLSCTVDSFYLEHPLSRTSLYLELKSQSLCIGCNLFISLYLELSLSQTNSLVPCEFEIERVNCSCDVFADGLRIAFTRVRLSSHRLRVETGRWARIPHDQRLCQCGLEVQTEQHVLANCHLVDEIRSSYSNASVDFVNFMASHKSAQQLAMIERILDFYEHL